MKKKLHPLPFLLSLILLSLFCAPLHAEDGGWTEKKLGSTIIKAEKAAKQKKWHKAIQYGEHILKGCHRLNNPSDPRYIHLRKNLNRYYDKAGRLGEVETQVKETYFLSKKVLGLEHETTRISSLLYYKILMSKKAYYKTIALVQESISILPHNKVEDFRRLHYLTQLYSLYGKTKQYPKEEKILLKLLPLNQRLVGRNIEDSLKIILSLARTYCRQEKPDDFKGLMTEYNLDYEC